MEPETMTSMEELLTNLNLHTICESAQCPNAGSCFKRKTATFLILGNVCTRNCRFCAVDKGKPLPVDAEEPEHLLEAVEKLGLLYVVITSVTRDDLDDGGADQFVKSINIIHERRPGTRVEVLVPDFLGSPEAIRAVIAARPEVLNHNIETVPRLYPEVRSMADYRRSLELIAMAKALDTTVITKSGLMLGLGETKEEVIRVMRDLKESGCDLITLGQYLSPSSRHYHIARYVTPEEFAEFEDIARDIGFAEAASAPLVRSSYRAGDLYDRAKKNLAG